MTAPSVAAVRERPILFSGPMARAILEGRTTQTRRPLKPQPSYPGTAGFAFELHPFAPSAMKGTPAEGMAIGPEKKVWVVEDASKNVVGVYGDCPYGNAGDRLWVRETAWYDREVIPQLGYRRAFFAGTTEMRRENGGGGETGHSPFTNFAEVLDLNSTLVKRPSIHMPRWASRITLEIVDVRVELLRDITEDDAKAEGIDTSVVDPSPRGVAPIKAKNYVYARECFADLWDALNSERGFGWEINPFVWVLEFREVA